MKQHKQQRAPKSSRPPRRNGPPRRRMSPYWLFGGIAALAFAAGLVGLTLSVDWPLLITWPLVLTPITFGFYWFDKAQSKGDGTRVPEALLLLLALLGGFVGGFLAMRSIRNKTLHWEFWAAQGAGFALWCGVLWWFMRGSW